MLHKLTDNRLWLFIRGVAAIIFGFLAFTWPAPTLLAMVILIGAYALVDGISALVLMRRGPEERHRHDWLVIASAIAAIVVGVLTFIWPGITAVALLTLFATWSIVRGVFELTAAIRLHKEIRHEWLLGIAGALSIIVGVWLFTQPALGLLAMTWMIGFYAVALGVLYIGLAFELGRIDRHMPHARQA
jgi:uncharacterized membrane protein HdeD (DUF308 family)